VSRRALGPLPAAILLGSIVLLVGGCKRTSTPPSEPRTAHPVRVAFHRVSARLAFDEPVPRSLDEKRIESMAKGQLQLSRGIDLVPEPRPGSFALELVVRVGRLEGDREKRAVASSARARSEDAADSPALLASALVPLAEKGPPLETAVAKAVSLVLEDLLFQARLDVGPEEALVAALSQKDLERLRSAVEIAAVRRSKKSVPALIGLLRHPEEEVADRAIGALAAIGDRRAVRPLTRLVEFKDTARLAKLLDAIGTLGGAEAQNFLEFVATGHEDADIRSLAKEALERLQRTEAQEAKPPARAEKAVP
jgi:hypothetical protein